MSESNNTNKINNPGTIGAIAMGNSTVSDVKVDVTHIETKTEKNLADAAKEIQQLLTELQQNYPTNTESEQMVVVQQAIQRIQNNPTLKQRVVGALQAGSVETLKQMLNHPLVHILFETVKGGKNP